MKMEVRNGIVEINVSERMKTYNKWDFPNGKLFLQEPATSDNKFRYPGEKNIYPITFRSDGEHILGTARLISVQKESNIVKVELTFIDDHQMVEMLRVTNSIINLGVNLCEVDYKDQVIRYAQVQSFGFYVEPAVPLIEEVPTPLLEPVLAPMLESAKNLADASGPILEQPGFSPINSDPSLVTPPLTGEAGISINNAKDAFNNLSPEKKHIIACGGTGKDTLTDEIMKKLRKASNIMNSNH